MCINHLWLLSFDEHFDEYDICDACVVVAKTEAEARLIHPTKGPLASDDPYWISEHNYAWATNPERIMAVPVGIANANQKPGTIILSSFCAG